MKNIKKEAPVMVTGATGYVAGPLVEQLLKEGITVHAAVREPADQDRLRYLNALGERLGGQLRYFKTDLLEEGSYDASAQGCEVIFHTASPFVLEVRNPQRELLEPVLQGTRNVLGTANRTHTIKRVVLTSSCAAMFGDNADIQSMPDGQLTEAAWNTSSSLRHQPYSYAKTMAEREAWKIAFVQERWDLVSINPSLVIGPGIGPRSNSESFRIFQKLCDGTMKAGVPHFEIGVVDVREVAQAHFAAAFRPEASGRHILSAQTTDFLYIANLLSHRFPAYPFPISQLPKFLVWLLGPMAGMPRKVARRNVGLPWSADNRKSRKALGISYRPLEETIVEFFQFLVDVGVVPDLSNATRDGAKIKTRAD